MPVIFATDVETTGFSKKDDEITEIAGILWDTERSTYLYAYTTLVKGKKPINTEITKLTGIDNEMREEFGIEESRMVNNISALINKADYCMAHNAPFDVGFIEESFIRQGFDFPKKTWIDTKTDIPKIGKSNSLNYAAADHGFANPFAHRALTDVLTMIRLAEHYDWNDTFAMAASDYVELIAGVEYKDRDMAATAGFHWNSGRKQWLMKVKESQADNLTFGFPVTRSTPTSD